MTFLKLPIVTRYLPYWVFFQFWVFLSLSFPGTARAGEEMPLWKRVDSWEIRVDKTLGYGCFALANYKGGTAFRIGFNIGSKNTGYIIVGNNKWKSLEVGKEYPITLKFDKAEPWSGDAIGFKFDEKDPSAYLFLKFSDPELFKDFMRKTSLLIKYKQKKVTSLNLSGSAKAMLEVTNCQKMMNTSSTSSSAKDPFAKGIEASSDPFKN